MDCRDQTEAVAFLADDWDNDKGQHFGGSSMLALEKEKHMTTSTIVSSPPAEIPSLEPGDHLTRDEFERRYAAMPNVKKAELVEGVVHMPSPVRIGKHGAPHADLIGWLTHYKAFTPRVQVGDNSTVRLDLHNEVQPDGLLIVDPQCGGKVM